jgi:hypothetical protein
MLALLVSHNGIHGKALISPRAHGQDCKFRVLVQMLAGNEWHEPKHMYQSALILLFYLLVIAFDFSIEYSSSASAQHGAAKSS